MTYFHLSILVCLCVLLGRAAFADEAQPLRVPAGFVAAPGTTAEPHSGTGYALTIVHEQTQIELVFIPAGTFQMGSPENEPGRAANEGPAHTVRITRPFYMGKTEVSQEQWTRLMGPDRLQGARFPDWAANRYKGEQKPAVGLSMADCDAFMKKAGACLRLPTEAEWEYACRAGTRTAYGFGDSEAKLSEHAWNRENAGGELHPVGQKPPNAWGLHDIHGNVFEWCSDRLGSDYYANSPEADPTGDPAARFHVLRGGSFISSAPYCRAAFRHFGQPLHEEGTTHLSDYGFRVVRGE